MPTASDTSATALIAIDNDVGSRRLGPIATSQYTTAVVTPITSGTLVRATSLQDICHT